MFSFFHVPMNTKQFFFSFIIKSKEVNDKDRDREEADKGLKKKKEERS